MPPRRREPSGAGDSLFAAARRAAATPLAARMRPATLDEFVGQRHLLGPGKPLRDAIEQGRVLSMIFWGPPGTGKTTLARLVAQYTDRAFAPFSAVTEGVPRVREIVAEADARLQREGRGTILFVDEIHRFNRAQQDAFLPHVEAGTITLIGATTENPSFALTGALLSRTRVFVLEPLSAADLEALLRRALTDAERGLGARALQAEDGALATLAQLADGDARRALTALEAAADAVGDPSTGSGQARGVIDRQAVVDALQRRVPHYDNAGEEHFNMLSAYHKSLRGSDPHGALYWMARMIEGGEDPLTIFRRAIAMASEDIGLADPEALKLAIAAREAFRMLGPPEGYLALSQMTIYLATAPKSNRSYLALQAALEAARASPAAPVPLHIRNAPTALMKELGYHEGYQYAHSVPEAYIPQEYLPEHLRGQAFYEPGSFGFEREIAKRMAWWGELRARQARGPSSPDDADRAPEGTPPDGAAPDAPKSST